jgi:hypothetical protein
MLVFALVIGTFVFILGGFALLILLAVAESEQTH